MARVSRECAVCAGSGGGGSISKKHRHKLRGTFETSDEEEVVEVKKLKGRKGDRESSRAKKGSRDNLGKAMRP